ncbi:MAG: class I SAM-dependent RNA methyltransferase [Algoriphagus sp.]|jgi:putative N6-adenine-specific DNA methylase|uniref:THUMP domain-containing class I SAM-dependent RNA methyltransferase n=1 Tax=Algoriphagus sp. TaxID=1872435 RepID=UPI0027460AD9|nr:class I SAM-dependent RNA methyltransferase [Algoriphagus sp.]MDP4748768.1 class I SAM-dependent RNA methyltransferase [Algoriphagus sp.]MDP4837981.1 class I SAM-dependent RNA methyltransferase [Algoriphagus sp.]MDP4904296.1 class I SAM-dependent RNA methyltransferase [Algoriphagus sp.]MDP4958167.1 class I SAM-dependent RNA methyltransferase [Algoriphagus sp.]
MLDFNTKGKVFITCKDRSVSYLEQELRELGFFPVEIGRTGIEIHASLEECMDINLHLRTASHVLYEIKSFYLRNADDIYRRFKAIPWEEYLDVDGYFSVNSVAENESITTPLIVNVKVKDAIVDRFRELKGRRPDSGSDFSGLVIQVYWKETQAIVYLNTSGETLAKHGYRKIPGKAPMMEALAAATIYASEWNTRVPFINPMCGSGTLAIEAALMASKRYPGLYRENYSFQHILGYNEEIFQAKKRKLENKIIDNPGVKIVASDISLQAITFARENAAFAGVEDLIDFQTGDFAETEIPEKPRGVILFNPEYGERLGDLTELEETYKRMGDFMKQKCAGYRGYIFTGNLDLAKKVGLKASRRIEFWNGTIDCRLLKYDMYEGKKEGGS